MHLNFALVVAPGARKEQIEILDTAEVGLDCVQASVDLILVGYEEIWLEILRDRVDVESLLQEMRHLCTFSWLTARIWK